MITTRAPDGANKNVLYYGEFDNLRPWESCLKKPCSFIPQLCSRAQELFFKDFFLWLFFKNLSQLCLGVRAVLKFYDFSQNLFPTLFVCARHFLKDFFLWRFFKNLSFPTLFVSARAATGWSVGWQLSATRGQGWNKIIFLTRDGTKPFFKPEMEQNHF